MGHVVGGFGVPHTPHFPSWSDQGGPLALEIDRLYGEVAGRLEAVAADVLVVFTSDHYNAFFESSVPIFSIAVGDSVSGPSDYPTIARREFEVASTLARQIQEHAVRSDFDVGMSQELELDHSLVAPLHFLTPASDIPLVPVFISAFMRPIASARRCFALGQAIREAVESAPSPQRVAAVASGGFSFEVGGPRLSPDSHVGVPDTGWVDRVCELLRAADVERLLAEATDEQLAQAGNAAAELLNWIAVLGMIDPAPPPDFLEAQTDFGHAYAAWPLETR
jgi:gallate dioxygenase